VKQTVEGAQASVEDMVENVRGTVGETVATVRHTFDVHHQAEQHPWLMVSGSLVVGYLLGNRSGGSTSAALSTTDPRLAPASPPATASRASPARSQPQQEMGSGVRERVKDEIGIIEGAVMGAVVRTLGEMVKHTLLPPTPPITSARTNEDKARGLTDVKAGVMATVTTDTKDGKTAATNIEARKAGH
jgi:hypothetical protein